LENVAHATDMFKSFPPARPIWLAQDDVDASLIVPKAYLAIVNGVTGIGYWAWENFKASPAKFAAARQVFSELGQLKSVLFSQNVDSSLTQVTGGIETTARYLNGTAYVFAVNSTPQTVQSIFRIPGLIAGQKVQVMFENRTITASTGQF